jgi:hypothetical protein
MQTIGQRKFATQWQAKSKHTAAIVLDREKVKNKYKKPPRPPMKPLDLWWSRALTFSYTSDALVIIWFMFLAFVFFPTIDPRVGFALLHHTPKTPKLLTPSMARVQQPNTRE